MTATIAAAASALAHARAAAEQTAKILAEATAAQSRVNTRIAECQAARSSIRRRGPSTAIDEDGVRLALLGADIETLEEMKPERDRAVAEARAADAAARQQVGHAEHVLATERDAELTRRLVDKAANRRQSWAPPRELTEAIQRLYLNANGVRR
jgi:hypothetical protein